MKEHCQDSARKGPGGLKDFYLGNLCWYMWNAQPLHLFPLRLLSLSLSQAPGTSITMSQNPSSAITSYQICTCSGGKQVHNSLHLQRALLFLNHCQSTKIKRIWSFVPVTELVPAKLNGRHPFPQGIHCLVGKKKHRSNYLGIWCFRSWPGAGLTGPPSSQGTANGH